MCVCVCVYSFNVYVSQPEVKPGCVLRKSNTAILEKKGIISQTEAASCKRNMNRCVRVISLSLARSLYEYTSINCAGMCVIYIRTRVCIYICCGVLC